MIVERLPATCHLGPHKTDGSSMSRPPLLPHADHVTWEERMPLFRYSDWSRACDASRTLWVILWSPMWLSSWTPGTTWAAEARSHLSYGQGPAWKLNQARGKHRRAMAAESNSAPPTLLEKSWVRHGWGSYNLIDFSQETKFFYWLNLAPSRALLGNGLDHIQECPAKRAQ